MNATETRKQLLLNRRENGVAVILLDCPGKLNSLGTAVMNELKLVLANAESDPAIKAIVMMSGKPDTFIIGADLFEIRKTPDQAALLRLSSDGQETLNVIANFKKPVVIAINGACLGGGLELALAAHWRIASNAAITQIGLPETRLGIIPGLGGTQRLPRLIGLKSALGIILSAEPVSAQEALEVGLVDELVNADDLMKRAEQKALELIPESEVVEERRRLVGTTHSSDAWPIKDVDAEKANKLFAMTERSIRIKTKGNYPAQTRVIEVIKKGITDGIVEGLRLEAETFAELAVSDVSANLIALFFQTDFAKQSAASLAAKFGEQDTHTVAIIGGGVMGSSIAELAAGHGMKVLLKTSPGKATQICEHIRGENVECVEDYSALKDAQIVVECVTEDLQKKQQVLREVEQVVSPECAIASNTSSLSLNDICDALEKKDRFSGLHFFHPVDKMPLVEIVGLKSTARKALGRCADLVTKLGKIPLMVKDGPGFLIDRLLTCYLLEAARLTETAMPLNWIDEAAVDFGMPMGPYELLDEVGLDLAFTVAATLHEELGERMRPPGLLLNIPKLGLVGKKTGVGVYLYEDGRRKEINPKVAAIPEVTIKEGKADEATRRAIMRRLLFVMIDEAARCLEDRIVMKPRELDMAVVYGLGFPPFRGGLLKYADTVGLKEIVEGLQAIYAEGEGKRSVSALLCKYLAEGRNFYSLGGKEEE